MANARDILVNLLGKETVSPAANKAGDALDKMGDQAEGAARDAKKLDQEIEDLNKSLAANAAAWRAAGTAAERADLTKAMRGDQRKLREALNVRKILEEDSGGGRLVRVGAKLGLDLSQGIVGGLRTTLSGPQGAAALAGLAAGAAPFLSSTIAAAVTTGVALGVAGGGIALAFKDPKVQAEAKSLGAQIGRDLKTGASSFIPEVLKSLDLLGEKSAELRPQIRGMFDVGAARVVPLTQSLTRALDELVPALAEANANADPLMETLGEHIPKFAGTAGDALRKFSEDSQNSAAALDTLLTAAEAMVGGSATIIGFLNKIGPAVAGPLYAIGALSEDSGDKIEEASQKTAGWDASFRMLADSSATAQARILSFSEAIEEWTSRNLGAENANLRLQAAIDAATAAGKKNNDGIDAGNAKGRENRELLIQLADAANANANAIYEQTGSMEQANAATAAAKAQFIAAARAMGVGAAEAERLAGMLFAIPSPNPKVTLNTKQAKAEAKVIQDAINGIHGKNVTVGIYFVTHGRNKGDLKVPGGFLTQDRWGGVHVPMAAGGVMAAGIYPASNPPLIQFAEPATGGEAYIPRRGNPQRSAQILDQAASWYDMAVVPRRQRAARGAATGGGFSEDRLAAALARALAGMTLRIDDRTATLVDLYMRGG